MISIDEKGNIVSVGDFGVEDIFKNKAVEIQDFEVSLTLRFLIS